MAKIIKPTSRLIWAIGAAPADVIDPGDTKFEAGWQSEIPAFEHFNYLQQLFTGFIQYLNQEGIAEWDATSTYFIGSYARSGAILYRSLIDDNINFAVTDVSRWAVAFLVPSNNLSDVASVATARTNLSVYSKAETDAAYTTKANNLSDLVSVGTARTNLSVYSKTETDSKFKDINTVFTGSSSSVDMDALAGGWPGDGVYSIGTTVSDVVMVLTDGVSEIGSMATASSVSNHIINASLIKNTSNILSANATIIDFDDATPEVNTTGISIIKIRRLS